MTQQLRDWMMLCETLLSEAVAGRKVLFTAGSPGAGKSTILRLVTGNLGFKYVDTDKLLANDMARSGLNLSMPDEEQGKVNALRGAVYDRADRMQSSFTDRGLPLIIDTTGADLSFVQKLKAKFEAAGYDAMMIYVVVDLDAALTRNKARTRSIPPAVVRSKHAEVSANRIVMQQMFRNFYQFDNTGASPATNDPNVVAAFRAVQRWALS